MWTSRDYWGTRNLNHPMSITTETKLLQNHENWWTNPGKVGCFDGDAWRETYRKTLWFCPVQLSISAQKNMRWLHIYMCIYLHVKLKKYALCGTNALKPLSVEDLEIQTDLLRRLPSIESWKLESHGLETLPPQEILCRILPYVAPCTSGAIPVWK